MNETRELSTAAPARAPELIVAEIKAYTGNALASLIEAGRRLVELKETVPYGEFGKWVEAAGHSRSSANNLMRLFEAYGSPQGNLFGAEVADVQTFGKLSYTKALALLALPSGEREEFVEAHDVESMSTRELQQAIRERDEAKAAADTMKEFVESLEKHNTELETRALEFSNENDDLKERIKELENRPVDVAVQVDEEAVKKAADEARAAAEAEWSAKVKEAEDKLAKAEEKAEKAKEKRKVAEDALAEANEKLEAAKKQQAAAVISSDKELATFELLFQQAQEKVNAMHGVLMLVRGRGDEALTGKLQKALLALSEAIKGAAT